MAQALAVTVRPLEEADLGAADRVFRVAFGTFLGVDDPEHFFGDADYVNTRWRTDRDGAIAAELDGSVVGSNFVTNWGSVGFFGPLSVAPELWNRAVAQQLLSATMERFAALGTRHCGLFTFAQSAKHVGLYQRFGFWPRYLTAIMSRPVRPAPVGDPATRLSELSASTQAAALAGIRAVTEALYEGLDLGREIGGLLAQGLGDVVLVDDAGGPRAVAICHIGAGSEAGGGNCYLKFAGVRPGTGDEAAFERLIGACERLAAERGAATLVAGANAERERAWRALVDMGFRWDGQGVALHRPNDGGYNRPDAFIVDDWR